MTLYKTEYYTLSRGRQSKGKVGNLRQFSDTAYIQCANTSCVEVRLEKYYETSHHGGIFYHPVITSIEAIEGHTLQENQDDNTATNT